jgi:hypothetical protein
VKHAGRITGMRVLDVRFPTSASRDGSDAMNPALLFPLSPPPPLLTYILFMFM